MARTYHGLSPRELAIKINAAPTTINAYERGARAPDIYALRRIALALHVSTDYLLGLSARLG